MIALIPMNKLLFLTLLFAILIPATGFPQDPPSLGDIARQYREKKDVSESSSEQSTSQTQNSRRVQLQGQLDVSKLDPDNYMSYVVRLFAAQDFDALDRLAASERAGKTRFVGGGWRLYTLYLSLDTPTAGNPQDADYLDIIHSLERWKSTKPESITPRVALAETYLNYAWHARGSGYAGDVTKGGWQSFGERIDLAKRILAEAFQLKEKCPEWYVPMQQIAMAEGWDKDHENVLMNKAVSYEPDYYYYYQAHARYLLPKWNGEPGDVERFAEETANKLGGERGDFIYYKIADEVTCECEDSPNLSWPRIQKGYAVLTKRYGESLMLMNKLAFLAVHYQDVQVAQQTFAKIGDRDDLTVWGSESYFQQCKQWAADKSHYQVSQDYNARITVEFLNKYAKTVATCATNAGLNPPNFNLFLQLAENGSVEKVITAPAIKDCVSEKLQTAVLSPPPSAHYGVPINVRMAP